jgi:uncharacterized membrane protein YbhN (UPF0104 family)
MSAEERSAVVAIESPSRASWVRRAIPWVFYAVVIALLVVYVARLDFASLASIRIGWHYLALALVVGLGQRLLIPLVWVLMLRSLGVSVRRYASFNFVYAKAWLGRYVPGKVAMVAARVYFADELGASRSVIAVSSLAEIGAQLFVTGVVGLLGVASFAGSSDAIAPYLPITYGLIAGLGVFVWPPVFNAAMRLLFKIVRRPTADMPRVSARTLAWAVGGFLVVSAMTGVLAVLLAGSVDPVALDHAFFVWGAYSLAGVLGMAFVFTPSGIGAREAIQLPLFALVVSPEAAVAIALVSRVAELAIDGLFYGVSALWSRLAAR